MTNMLWILFNFIMIFLALLPWARSWPPGSKGAKHSAKPAVSEEGIV